MTLNKIRTLLLGGVAGLITVAYSPGAYAIDFTMVQSRAALIRPWVFRPASVHLLRIAPSSIP